MNESWEQLRQHSDWSETPWVAFLFTSSSANAHQMESKMQEWLDERGQTQRILRPKTPQALREALSFLLSAVPETNACTWIEAVHIDVPQPDGAPPGPWTEAWDSLMLRANTRREQILRNVRGGLMFVGVPERKDRIRRAAPDLWSIRALVLEPEPVQTSAPLRLGLGAFPSPTRQPDSAEAAEAARAALARATGLAARSSGLDQAARQSVHRTRILANSRAIEALLHQGWITEAAPLIEELLELATAQLQEHPGRKQQTWLANAKEYQAAVLREQGDLTGAQDALFAALELRCQLVDSRMHKRTQRQSDIARTWSLIGGLALHQGDLDEALQALVKARDLRQQLVEWSDDPESISELAMSHSLLGDLHLSRGDLLAGKKCFEDALELRRQLAETHNAHRFRRYLSVAWGRLGLVSHRLGNLALARTAFREAWSLAQALSDIDPGNVTWLMETSVAASRWADLALADQELDQAEEAFRYSLDIREKLVAEDPENNRWMEYLAVGLGRMSKIMRARGDDESADRYAVRAAAVSDAVADAIPDSARAQRGRATAWLRLLELRGADAARTNIRKTMEQLERLGATHHVQAIEAALKALDPT